VIGVLAATLAGAVVAAGPASAAANDQWQRCIAESSATVWFDQTSVMWLDNATIHWSVSTGPDCWPNALAWWGVSEDTPQTNDNPQGFTLGTSRLAGTQVVTPLRSLPWGVWMFSTEGAVELARANIEVDQPSGPPTGGPIVTVTDNSDAQRRNFVRAVKTPGTTVRVAGNVNLDLSGLDEITVAPNVQILGDRSVNPLGPLLFTTTEPGHLFTVPRPADATVQFFSQERISGIRLRGGSSTDPFDNMGDEDSTGITVEKPNVEIDHNEIYLWRGAGVEVQDCGSDSGCPTPDILTRPAPGSHATTVWIHDNYIHHDQHPAGDICCGHAGGYGVESSHGGYALIEQNVFDYNRHSIAGGWQPGTGYLLYRNLILPNGGDHSRVAYTHAIDVHGAKGPAYESGAAGEYFDVEYNTVWYHNGPGVKLRGTPSDKMEVRHNVFAHCGLWTGGPPLTTCSSAPPALVQNESGLQESDNLTTGGVVFDDARTSCDFDGDGVNDTFHATGATWWFQSSRLAGRYVYLYQSGLAGSHLVLGDRNADGLCDVTADGYTVDTSALAVGTPIGVVPYVLGSTEAAARDAVAAGGLTVGTVTYQPSTTPAGLVIDQSPHWWYVRPAGWPVNLVVSLGAATVPNVLGMDQASAENYIGMAGLSVGNVSYTNNCVDPGSVQTQNPSGGARVAPGSTVNLSVSTCNSTGGGGNTGGGGTGGGGNPIREK
jgi:hypothetical protein